MDQKSLKPPVSSASGMLRISLFRLTCGNRPNVDD